MNLIETTAAFAEGLALIASPCILPVLPLVLGASTDGGRKRPFGIIIGFILSFTVFALASRKIVTSLGIDLDIIKNASLLLLFTFGLILLSEKLSEKFSSLTQGAANLGNTLSTSGKDGLLSGIFIGSLIGLVWTPCAGPIMAAVLVQVIRQQTDFAGFIIILSFAVGAGLPMLIMALTGRKIMNRISFLATHAEAIRKTFGALIIVAVAFIASGINTQSLLPLPRPTQIAQAPLDHLENALEHPYSAAEITGIAQWFNFEPLNISDLKGKVVLVDFWTYSCINCVRTLPYITEWDRKYRKDGLVIIGIHAPEFEFEKKPENVKAAIAAHGIAYPVALDNQLVTWNNFHNQYWPAHYLIDKTGRVVYTHFGEGHYDVTENNIRYLLGLNDKVAEGKEKQVTSAGQTPETYLGYSRMENFAGADTLIKNTQHEYVFPASLPDDYWALKGKWTIEAERIVAGESGAAIRIHFTAGKVFLVLGTQSNTPIDIVLTLNSKPQQHISVTSHSLYTLISENNPQSGLLEITSTTPGLEAYAFTFGN